METYKVRNRNHKIKKMRAFVITEITIHNPELYEEYKKLTPASIAEYGGKFVVRGGKTISMEGDWDPQRIVVAEFPSLERAQEWWHSEGYERAKKIRHASAHTKMIIVESAD
jgi:uncharacterized protein (DUF1330 family)